MDFPLADWFKETNRINLKKSTQSVSAYIHHHFRLEFLINNYPNAAIGPKYWNEMFFPHLRDRLQAVFPASEMNRV